jgi:hypothetical protein
VPVESQVRRRTRIPPSVVSLFQDAIPKFKSQEGRAPGLCRVCGCTQERGCNDACSWVTSDLCSTCARAIVAVQYWMENANRSAAARLIREARERAGR